MENSNDKLLAGLAYPIPIVGIIILVSDSMKNNPVLRKHAIQGLALAVVLGVIFTVIGLIPFIGIISCVSPLIYLGITGYYGYQAYQGQDVTVPMITDFCRNQKWF